MKGKTARPLRWLWTALKLAMGLFPLLVASGLADGMDSLELEPTDFSVELWAETNNAPPIHPLQFQGEAANDQEGFESPGWETGHEKGPRPPVLEEIFPDTAPNTIVLSVDIFGTNLSEPTLLQLRQNWRILYAENIEVIGPTLIRCDFDLIGQSPGQYTLEIETFSGFDSLKNAFQIRGPGYMHGDDDDDDITDDDDDDDDDDITDDDATDDDATDDDATDDDATDDDAIDDDVIDDDAIDDDVIDDDATDDDAIDDDVIDDDAVDDDDEKDDDSRGTDPRDGDESYESDPELSNGLNSDEDGDGGADCCACN